MPGREAEVGTGRVMSAHTIRPATPSDASSVGALWHSAYYDDPGTASLPDEFLAERNLREFTRRASEKVPHMFVASEAGAAADAPLAGFCVAYRERAEMEQLFVARHARGTGVAARLIAAAERSLAASPTAVTAFLVAFAANARGRRFYEKCGWACAGPVVWPVEISGGNTYPLSLVRYEKRVGEASPQEGGGAAGPEVPPAATQRPTSQARPEDMEASTQASR